MMLRSRWIFSTDDASLKLVAPDGEKTRDSCDWGLSTCRVARSCGRLCEEEGDPLTSALLDGETDVIRITEEPQRAGRERWGR